MAKKNSVTIVEVGLRDGLQNETVTLPANVRVEFARNLAHAGVQRMEIGAFVRPDKVPQMADSVTVIEKTFELVESQEISGKIHFSALVPNEKGMVDALKTPLKEVAVFAACSESFSQKNINCSIEESFERFEPVFALAKKNKIRVRGYLSTCFGCPYEGPVSEKKVIDLAKRLIKMGCFEVSIGDTIGVANPLQVQSLFKKLKRVIPVGKLAGHFHDTRGGALANILAAYQVGIRIFDTSLGGLGGCPYAPGASGNVATEDVVYMFQGMKISTGLDLVHLIEINHWLSDQMKKTLPSKVGQAGVPRPLGKAIER